MDRHNWDQQNYGTGFHDGAYQRKTSKRAVTDYGSLMVRWMRNRQPRYKGAPKVELERPSPSYIAQMMPPTAKPHNPADAIPAKHLHSSLNKARHAVNVVRWTPEGRRLLTGSYSGEFTLWNGTAFNFETIMQAHDVAIRSATYSHNEDWLLSACNDGVIKYWQPNFNNVKAIQAHTDPIRGISFSPNDAKFVTASDDATLKIFDFSGGVEESTLTGHQWDAKTVDWHPTKGLLVSGSKDHQVKLWDPRTGRCLTTLHGHKNTLTKTLFEPSRGQLLATCGRDQVGRVFDLRMMRDICLLRGHEKEVSTLTWHPFHTCLLSTGGNDGSIFHYLLNEPNTPANTTTSIPPYDSADPKNAPAQTIYPAHRLQHAHDMPVWSLDWHPLGHILASGSNDRVTRFWTRARPGETDCFNDRWHIGGEAAEMLGTWDRRNGKRSMREEEEMEIEDEADGLVDQTMPSRNQATLPGLPGLTLPSANASTDNSSGPIRNGLPPPNNNLPPPPMIPPPGGIPGMDPAKFAELLASGKFPPPPPPGIHAQGFPPPPPLPPNFDFSKFPPGLFPPPIPIPPPPSQEPTPGGLPGLNDNPGGGGGGGSVRRRGPLPSQQESLKMEQQKGKYRPVR
ncbi:pre-mRNA cleavage and polyadenylation factor (CPF) complex subunit [Xanthoria calcicola]